MLRGKFEITVTNKHVTSLGASKLIPFEVSRYETRSFVTLCRRRWYFAFVIEGCSFYTLPTRSLISVRLGLLLRLVSRSCFELEFFSTTSIDVSFIRAEHILLVINRLRKFYMPNMKDKCKFNARFFPEAELNSEKNYVKYYLKYLILHHSYKGNENSPFIRKRSICYVWSFLNEDDYFKLCNKCRNSFYFFFPGYGNTVVSYW